MKDFGIMLVVTGSAIVLAGVVVLLAGRLPWLGNLPGDVQIRGKNWSFSFPIVTCVVVSVLLTILLNILGRLFRR